MDTTNSTEKTPLLFNGTKKVASYSGSEHVSSSQSSSLSGTNDKVSLKRHLNLLHAIVFILVNITGTGIFVVPSGVTRGVGSVGSSLLIWSMCGVYNIALALCYAELGTAFPSAAGDYAFIREILGPMCAFVVLFVYVLLAPVATAIMSRTVGEYLLPLAGLECNYYIVIVLALFLNFFSAAINTLTVKWTARLLNVLMAAKLLAFSVIIVMGLIQLGHGQTTNFTFEGSTRNPSSIAAAFVPAYTSFAGWDIVCSIAGEMKSPKRDIPLSLMIAMTLTTSIYVLVNVAFFSALTPQEVMQTNAVGTLFAMKVSPGYEWIIPVFVSLSALGTLVAVYLGLPRYVYAGAKDGELPAILSNLSIHYYTPLPAIGLQLFLSIFMCSATFFDIQGLFNMMGISLMLKMAVALIAQIVMKRKMNHLSRALNVPLPFVVICLLLLLGIVVLAVIQDPYNNGIGCLIFLVGIPIYCIGILIRKSKSTLDVIDTITRWLQCIYLVVPEDAKKTQ